VKNGADVNAEWSGYFPILFAPCETVEPAAIRWLLDHGADPNCAKAGRKYPDNALDYVMSTYSRSEDLGRCIDMLLAAGCTSRRTVPGLLNLLRGRMDLLAAEIDADPSLVSRRFAALDLGGTAYRRLRLGGAMLLHVAAEYGNMPAARLLVERGADVNARAEIDDAGAGGQTPIYHAATQFFGWGLDVVAFLVDQGADLSVRVKIPGHYHRPEEFVECTPLEYALLFPGPDNKAAALLRDAEQHRPG
jgi:hypothetical protein